ncbi:MAG: DUF3168 domain-containing protein [Brevundimonas sp.]|nr:MAG: DUF3168 domain-containing protein [Brevundimonas sp.]
MEAALIAELLATTNLTALVGQRINWLRRSQGAALPAVVLHRIDGTPDYHLTAASGLVESRIQADCWGRTLAESLAVANAVEAALSGRRFERGVIRFDAILIADRRDDSFDESGSALFRSSLDLMVHHASAS